MVKHLEEDGVKRFFTGQKVKPEKNKKKNINTNMFIKFVLPISQHKNKRT